MPPRIAMLLSCAALALPISAASAQTAPAAQPFRFDKLTDPAITAAIEKGDIEVDSSGEIIVEGTTEKEIRNFVWRSITSMSGRKIAIRAEPMCISFDNIDAELERQLRQRIAENLATIGTRLEDPGCTVNTAVAFPRDAHAFVNWLWKKKPQVFGALYSPERRRHIRPQRMAYNWHYVAGKGDMRETQRAGGTLDDVWQRTLFFTGGVSSAESRIVQQLGTDAISHSFTVIQASALEGITPTQLADYITMHALVTFEPGVRAEVPQGSILRLFDENGANELAAEEMSAVDRVVLSTLYRSGRSYFSAGLIRDEIARTATKDRP